MNFSRVSWGNKTYPKRKIWSIMISEGERVTLCHECATHLKIYNLQIHNAGPTVLIPAGGGAAHPSFSLLCQIHFYLNHLCLLTEFFPLRRNGLRASSHNSKWPRLTKVLGSNSGCEMGIAIWEHLMGVNPNLYTVSRTTQDWNSITWFSDQFIVWHSSWVC